MDNRRGARTAASADEPSGARRPATRHSPSRRSPVRKSPSRLRGESTTLSPKKQQQRPPSVQSNATEDGSRPRGRPRKSSVPTSIPEDAIIGGEPSTRNSNRSPRNVQPPVLSEENVRNLAGGSSVTSRTSSTTTTSRVQVTGAVDDRHDLGQVSSRYRQEALDSLDRMEQQSRMRFTPTPSEASRRSVRDSRSRSHSVAASVMGSVVGDNEFSDADEDDRPATATNRAGSIDIDDAKYKYYSAEAFLRMPLSTCEFGGQWGAIALMLISAFGGFYLQTACTRGACELYMPNEWPSLEMFYQYFHKYIAYLYLGLASWTFTLYWISFGRQIRVYKNRQPYDFCFNGVFVSATVLLCIYVVTFFYDFPVMNLMYMHYTKFVSVAIAFAFVLAGWGYRRSLLFDQDEWNTYARTGNVIIDYYAGRQVNPFWSGHVDVKLTHYRFNVVIALLINTMFFVRNFEFAPLADEAWERLSKREIIEFFLANNKYDMATLIVTSLTLIYVIDLLMFEHHLISSAELRYEGMGAHTLLRYALYPVELSMMSKYVFEHHVAGVPTVGWAIMITLYLFGLGVKRQTNGVKYDRIINSKDPRYKDTKCYLPTPQDNTLIISGFWGMVQHPNYTGDIITKLAICIPLFWRFAWPPLLVTIWTIVILVHRVERVNHRNGLRFGYAWAQYMRKVPFKLIPHVY